MIRQNTDCMQSLINWIKQLFGGMRNFPGIIAAKVTAIEKHPNADRLQIVELTDGTNTIGPVVCGAFNFEVGDNVALALPGAIIPRNVHSDTHESFTLSKTAIRGIESQGMICSGFELNLDESTEPKILVLKPDTQLGATFIKEMMKSE